MKFIHFCTAQMSKFQKKEKEKKTFYVFGRLCRFFVSFAVLTSSRNFCQTRHFKQLFVLILMIFRNFSNLYGKDQYLLDRFLNFLEFRNEYFLNFHHFDFRNVRTNRKQVRVRTKTVLTLSSKKHRSQL